MPYDFATCLERDIVLVRLTGHVSFDEILDRHIACMADVNYRAGRPELVDASGVEGTDLAFATIKSILRRVGEIRGVRGSNYVAVVCAPDHTVFGLARMAQIISELSSRIRLHAFQEEAEALASLNLGYESFAELRAGEALLPPMPRARERAPVRHP